MDERKNWGHGFSRCRPYNTQFSLKCQTKVEDFSSHTFSTDFSDFRVSLLRRTLWALTFPSVQTPLYFANGPVIKRINFGWGIVWQLYQQIWRLLKQIQPFLGTVQFVCTSRVRLNAKLAFVHFYCGKYVFFIKRDTQDRWNCFLKLLFFSLG